MACLLCKPQKYIGYNLDEKYRKSFYKDNIPEEKFVEMYIDAITDITSSNEEKLGKIEKLLIIQKEM